MSTRTRLAHIVASAVITTAAVALGTVAAPAASAAPRWAPASKATIYPGVRTFTSGTQCRAGFIFYDAHAVYLSQAARCSDGLPLGTWVKIEGASRPGRLVYNSWLVSGIDGNDFALVRIDNVDKGRVNPSVPFWGGPTGDGGRSRRRTGLPQSDGSRRLWRGSPRARPRTSGWA